MSEHINHTGTAFITGASSGIGATYAKRLAARGYNLILVARDKARLDTLAAQLRQEFQVEVETIQADLTQKADLTWLEERLQADDSSSFLVNNAGIGEPGPLVGADPDRLETMIQLNVVALTRIAGAVVTGFVQRGRGTLVNISSAVALNPEMLNGSYSGTKAYVVNYTQALHNEVAKSGVQVQAVLPGAIKTEFWDRQGIDIGNFPASITMSSDELVDAALAGLDQGELITIPSLPDFADFEKFETARKALGPNLSRDKAADRYQVSAVK